MRIAFDHQIFEIQSYGGISRYFVRLIENLLIKGEDVGVFAPLHQNRYLESLPVSVVHGRCVSHFLPKTRRLTMLGNKIVTPWGITKWHPQIVHETYYSKSSAAPKGCPIVVTVHDMIHEKYAQYYSSQDTTSRLKRLAVERADHVICVSENTQKDLLELFNVEKSKVSVVHHGFDKFGDTSLQRLTHMQVTKPYLLYVGSRHGYKNFIGLLQAIALSPSLRKDFDVVAFGGGAFGEHELKVIAELGFSRNHVRQVNGGDEVLGQLYSGATAFVYPSLYEGFGLPPLEAMALDCPVISSNASSMPEVIGDAGEFFDPTSISDIAQAIERVVYSPAIIGELIERGHQRIRLFTWERCADRTLDIYRRLVGNN